MISKRIAVRKDGKSSAAAALRYGEGLTPDRETGDLLDKSHRTRLGNFGIVDDGVYVGRDSEEMSELIELAAIEMQANSDRNTRVGADKKLAHFVVSFNQVKPSEAVLRDTEDSMMAAMKLDKNHFATFLHNDNGYWHLHIFTSRIGKEKPHRGNPLWHDQINRDKTCRELELRHNLPRDNGLHKVGVQGQIVEIPRNERRAIRDAKPAEISDRARTAEIYSGELTFQRWCNEIRIGDRLKHAKNWQDLHAGASAYGCEVKAKGAGFVICPAGEKGGIQLSKVGLKNLPAKFGVFEAAKPGYQAQREAKYTPQPTNAKGAGHYDKWREARDAFKPVKVNRLNEQREVHKQVRKSLKTAQQAELAKIRVETKGSDRFPAVSIAKMEHAVAMAALADRFSHERQALYKHFAAQGPGNTFRDYLVIEAGKGDNIALGLARKYGVDEATDVSRKRETDHLKIVAVVSGFEYRLALRINFTHRVERNGTVVFDLGQGRKITDSAISKQVQLNNVAANDHEAIATALRFATTRFGNPLTLYGSQTFKRLAVETAVLNNLGIKFDDPVLEAYRERFAAEQQQRKTPITKEKQNAFNHRSKHTQRIPPAHLIDRMHHLSDGDLVLDTERHVGALRQNVSDRVGQSQERGDHRMQRAAAGAKGTGSGIATGHGLPNSSASSSTSGVWVASGAGRGRTNPVQRIDVPLITPSKKPVQRAERASAKLLYITETERAIAERALVKAKLTEDKEMATAQEHELSKQASDRRETNRNYQPTLSELKAIDQVLIEQAKEKQQNAAEASKRAVAPAAEKPATEQHQPETTVEPTLQLSAAEWIATQHKPEVQPHQFGDERVEFAVAYVAIDCVVIDHGRSFAPYSIRPGTDWHVGQKIVIDKTGSIAVPTGRTGHEVSKGRAG